MLQAKGVQCCEAVGHHFDVAEETLGSTGCMATREAVQTW